MIYVVIWSVFLVLFYLFLWRMIRRTPVTGDDENEMRRISRLLKRNSMKKAGESLRLFRC